MNAKARGVLGAVSLVVLGMVLGVAIDRHLLLNEPHASAAAALHELTMSSAEERLDLTSDQRRQIDSIIAARHNSLRHAWQAVHSHLGAAVDSLHREIEVILTPAQRSEFREWLREVDFEQ
jgi:Spy/CpxP family protein refolding chaperone